MCGALVTVCWMFFVSFLHLFVFVVFFFFEPGELEDFSKVPHQDHQKGRLSVEKVRPNSLPTPPHSPSLARSALAEETTSQLKAQNCPPTLI